MAEYSALVRLEAGNCGEARQVAAGRNGADNVIWVHRLSAMYQVVVHEECPRVGGRTVRGLSLDGRCEACGREINAEDDDEMAKEPL